VPVSLGSFQISSQYRYAIGIAFRRKLNYISTVKCLAALEAERKIARCRPDGNRKARRCAFLTAEAINHYNNDQPAAMLLVGRGPIKNALDHWTLGRRIWGKAERGIFTEGRFLKPLHPPPPHIWEIRVTEPVIQVRLFCLFIAKDMLLLTNFHTRKFLDEGSNWSEAMGKSAEAWKSLLPEYSPFVGQSIGDYLSENYDDFPITTKAPRKKRAR
jgi:hypothetical protein